MVEDLTESIFGYKKVIVVDTSSLIVLNRQNRIDIPLYRPVWNMVKADISSGKLITPKQVKSELQKHDDILYSELKEYRYFFISGRPLLENISDVVNFNWQIAGKYNPHHADPYIISLAIYYHKLERTKVVIMTEESKFKIGKIPDVAKNFEIQSYNIQDYIEGRILWI